MGKIIWSKLGDDSLREVWEFYAEKSVEAANKIVAEIIETTKKIHFPEQYQIEETLGENYRRAIVRHFKIIYQIAEDSIWILEVFDTRQHPKKNK